MKNLKRYFAALLLSMLGLATSAFTQITPSADTYTNTADATTNFGAKTLLDVDDATQTTYIQFDLASIPAGASISQATLKLYVNAVTTAGNFNVDYVNGSWTESTITSSLAPALGTTIVSSVPLTAADKNQYILINVTPAVEAWLNGSQANDGIALVANGTFNASFDSKENTTTSHPPELDIVFAGDGTITGVATASGSGLMGGGASGSLNLALTNTCAANQVLQWNGSSWECSSAGSGTVTSIASGTGLTGGTITGSGTLSLAANACPAGTALSALPFTCSPVASLGANTFTGNQTVSGNLSATGVVTGSAFQIGSTLFAFGSSASNNAFLGFSGNSNASNTGGYNTATGASALSSNTSGYRNTANGVDALLANAGGSSNTASGVSALVANVGGSNNTASGASALLANASGNYNTASGAQSLQQNTTGSYNAALGSFAGQTLNNTPLTTTNDTAVGAGAGFSTGTLTNATAIGSNAEVAESNALVLGSVSGFNGATSNVEVGIGTTTPLYTLDVRGTGNFTGAVSFGSPVTFVAGQSFPNTITAVNAGTDVTTSSSGGTVTLNVDTSKVPQLNTNNIFTGSQVINSSGLALQATTSSTSSPALYGNSTATSGSAAGVYGASASANGVYGVSNSSSGSGVAGTNNSATGTAPGISGQSLSSAGTGVYGLGNGAGVTGTSNSASGNGIVGLSSGSGGYGVYGSNTANTGVYGTGNGSGVTGVTGSATGSGVVGVNSAGGYAGYFQGNAAVTGNLSIGGDAPMSHNPRMVWSGFLSGPLQICLGCPSFVGYVPNLGGSLYLDQPIVITRVIAGEPWISGDVGCVAISTGDPYVRTSGTDFYTLTLDSDTYGSSEKNWDSGPINVPIPAGTLLYIVGFYAGGGQYGCNAPANGSDASNVWVNVMYHMQ